MLVNEVIVETLLRFNVGAGGGGGGGGWIVDVLWIDDWADALVSLLSGMLLSGARLVLRPLASADVDAAWIVLFSLSWLWAHSRLFLTGAVADIPEAEAAVDLVESLRLDVRRASASFSF